MFDKTNQTDTSFNNESDKNYENIFEADEGDTLKEDSDIIFEFGEGDSQSAKAEDTLYRVIYNGKEVELSLDELKANAQKGLNYDHVKNEYDILRAQPGAVEMLKDARESGLSSKAYLSSLKLRDKRSRIEDMMSRGVDEKHATYVTDLEDRIERQRVEEEKRKKYYDFIDSYPDVDAKDIPSEVWEKFHSGMSLVAAYALYENDMLRQNIESEKQNAESEKRSTGSVSSSESSEASDAFLEGLLS